MNEPTPTDELRAIAEAATLGLWTFDDNCAGYIRASDFEDEPCIARAYAVADARYIATFDPPTVLALLDRLAALEAERADCDMIPAGEHAKLLIERAAGEARVTEATEAMIAKGAHVLSEWLNDTAPIGEHMYRSSARSAWEAMAALAKQEPGS